MDQLWTDTHTSLRKNEGTQGAPRPLVTTLQGRRKDGNELKVGFEFRYSGPEQIHAKPVAARGVPFAVLSRTAMECRVDIMKRSNAKIYSYRSASIGSSFEARMAG